MTLLTKNPLLYPCACLATLLTLIIPQITAAPTLRSTQPQRATKSDFEKTLETFLGAYYEKLLPEGGSALGPKRGREVTGDATELEERFEGMQGDQPVEDEIARSGVDDLNKTRDKVKRDTDARLRKDNWVEYIKSQILSQIGRTNSSGFTKPVDGPPLVDFNITQIVPKVFNGTGFEDDQITEKIRSFYPSCEQPTQPASEQADHHHNSEDVMNLFFDFDYPVDQSNGNIVATATLRLYRLPQNNTAAKHLDSTVKDDCSTNLDVVGAEEEKLLRVSVYWYTKYQKKKRVKRRLSDSKVIPEASRWVELSVKPATKAWSRAGIKNLGLEILVEDQEGKTLRADEYFKGASCTQPQNRSQPSYEMRPTTKPTNLTEFMAYLEEIQRQPFIVTYFCSRP